MKAYKDDLAYIHDAGFGDFAKNAASGLLQLLRKNGIKTGLVVDLGCGSGLGTGTLRRGLQRSGSRRFAGDDCAGSQASTAG